MKNNERMFALIPIAIFIIFAAIAFASTASGYASASLQVSSTSTTTSYSVSVSVDSSSYTGAQTIRVSGGVSPPPGPGTAADIRVIDPQGSIVHIDAPQVDASTGDFTDNFAAGGANWVSGTYTLIAVWSSCLTCQVYSGNTTFTYSPATTTSTSTSSMQSTQATYTVTFSEGGLPSGTFWSVTFSGKTLSNTGSTIAFQGVAAGTYSWNASGSISGSSSGARYLAEISSGSLAVPKATSQSVSYITQYHVNFASSPSRAGSTSPSGPSWYDASSSVSISASPSNSSFEFTTWSVSAGSSITLTNALAEGTTAIIQSPGTVTANFDKPVSPPVTNSVTVKNGSASTFLNTTAGSLSASIVNSTLPDGAEVNITAAVLAKNATPAGTFPLSLDNVVGIIDIRVSGSTSFGAIGTAEICFTNSSVTGATRMLYWNGTAWDYAQNEKIAGATICGFIALSALAGTPVIIGTPFDFSVSVSPTSASILQGSSTSETVSLNLISGSPQQVTLSTSMLPSGVAIEFGPSSCNPNCTSTMTVAASRSSSPGSYQIVITASGGGQTHSAAFDLSISTPTTSQSSSTSSISSSTTQTSSTSPTAPAVTSNTPSSTIPNGAAQLQTYVAIIVIVAIVGAMFFLLSRRRKGGSLQPQSLCENYLKNDYLADRSI